MLPNSEPQDGGFFTLFIISGSESGDNFPDCFSPSTVGSRDSSYRDCAERSFTLSHLDTLRAFGGQQF